MRHAELRERFIARGTADDAVATFSIALMATATTATSKPSIDSTVKLRSGIEMPIFGLGTWLSEGTGECLRACTAALDYGYNLIDTATMYENEHDVGAALSASPRGKEIFVVTKLKGADHGREKALAAIDTSLAKLQRKQVDLWLMHNPDGGSVVETWKAMLEAKAAGKVRAVGVSNFGVKQLQALKAAGLEVPEVNQIELHCWLQQRPMVEYCRAEGIVVMSYCPLARCKIFGETDLAKHAAAWGKTEAQCALRWLLQRGLITIPKSSNAERVKQNAVFDFELTECAPATAPTPIAPSRPTVLPLALRREQMTAMDALDQGFKASRSVNSMDRPWEEVM